MDKKTLSKKEQLQSMVQAYENPNTMSVSDGIANLKSAFGAVEQPVAPKPLPGEGEGFDDEALIAKMQAENAASNDPARLAKIQATNEAIKRYNEQMRAKLMAVPSVQQKLPGRVQSPGRIGQTYPAEE